MRNVRKKSVKWNMFAILMVCWMLPFTMLFGAMGTYMISDRGGQTARNLAEQLAFNNQICVERLNYAITASRWVTYDTKLNEIWTQYENQEIDIHRFYNLCNRYLTDQYRQEESFVNTMFYRDDRYGDITWGVYNTRTGGSYQQIQDYWKTDHQAVKKYAETLDTAIGFLHLNDRLYMVRNLLDKGYHTIGILIMELNKTYCLGPLTRYPMTDQMTIHLNNEVVMKGEKPFPKETMGRNGYIRDGWDLFIFDTKEGSDYQLAVDVLVDQDMLGEPFFGYPFIAAGMILCLVPLLLILLKMFEKHISRPITDLVHGAGAIENGDLGYLLEQEAPNREFQLLKDYFNKMSVRLKYQFEQIYQEEVALRDARIMALQSHINPHFMNNTLEIINWEARMGDNAKVSKMIEALSTLMDAAIDRRKQPKVSLAEEMTYVHAFLYIVSERFGKRLTVVEELSPELMRYVVPRLVLQPVIENAIQHGVVPNGVGTVTIRGFLKGDYLYLEIENDGTLSQEEEEKVKRLLAPDYDTSKESSGNMGIANVNQRLRILYGQGSGLTMESRGEKHVVTRLVIYIGETTE
ncbi:MAG: sensor histidine kinase [Lachnospiraceae bacterium]